MTTQYDKRHGDPYDRGEADSYYGRGCNPHYYVGATRMSQRIERESMTQEQIKAYLAGYEENERNGDFKDWGE